MSNFAFLKGVGHFEPKFSGMVRPPPATVRRCNGHNIFSKKAVNRMKAMTFEILWFVCYLDHYLACDGRKLFVKRVPDRDGVSEGQFPELTFQLVRPTRRS